MARICSALAYEELLAEFGIANVGRPENNEVQPGERPYALMMRSGD